VNPDGTDASALGSTAADSNGNFSMSITAPNGPVRFRAIGGSYVSEQNGATINSPSPLSVLVPSLQGNLTGLSINPLTTFVDSLTVGNISRGQNLATALSNSTASIEQDYGISNDPSGLSPLYTSAAIGTDSGRVGLILGAIVNEDQLACPGTPGGLVGALSSDISDGIFDGTISGASVSYCGRSLAAIAGTAQFGDALSGLQGLTLATSGFAFGGTNNSLTLNSVTAAQIAAEAVAIGNAVVAAAPPSINTFAATTPSMNTARYGATETLLPNGNVLIAGGENNFVPVSSTELYNSGTNTFAASTPLMTAARFGATATFLANGTVLIAGGNGSGGTAQKTVDLYQPIGNTFATSTPTMIAARTEAAATLLPNGKVLIAGGSFLSSTELYNPATNTFAAGPSMSAGRSFPTATLLPNGKVLIAGGSFNTSSSGALATADLYDPVANTFTAGPQMNEARFSATATLLPNGKVLISGGTQDGNVGLSSTELYDPVTNTFAASTSTPTMNQKRFAATATLLPDGKALIAGGVSFDVGAFSSTELYDPVANTFAATTPSMNMARYFATETLLPNGEVLIAGGFNANTSTFLKSTELYSP
ncbi:MAG: kelch repeat-containing protein, partial [Candidatus Binatus sp.]